jgi:antitoxin (DNA-binding transcriptional repressor) of toxin-antitoxin stability system
MQQISVEKAQTILSSLINSALKGEEIIIEQDDEHAVQLVPVAKTNSMPQFGSAKGLIDFAADFDEPLEDFAEYEK